MTDLEQILPMWRNLEAAGADYVLATVVAVEGPSYRRPGACMLIASDGRRAGTVSGGCLEAEIANRAWWYTPHGPSVRRYSTAEVDGERPYGSGCGGVVFVLLERRATADPLLRALQLAFERRVPFSIATALDGPQIGLRSFAGLELHPQESADPPSEPSHAVEASLQNLAEQALANRSSTETAISIQGAVTRVWTNFRPARPGLWIVGAGDDALPLVNLAKEMGWYVAVADGRSHLATRARFPRADEVHVLPVPMLPASESAERPPALANLRATDAAVVMTHSFDQDAHALASLLALEFPLAYIGVLGPQRRTREVLAEAARRKNLPGISTSERVERWLDQLNAPTGLDLGAEAPETIALSVAAEIQMSFSKSTARPLREVRAVPPAIGELEPN